VELMVNVDLAALMIHAEMNGHAILISEQLQLTPPKLEFALKMYAPTIQSVPDSLNTAFLVNVKTKIAKLKEIAQNQTSAQVQIHAVLVIKEVAPKVSSATTRTLVRKLNAMFMTTVPQKHNIVIMNAGTTDLATNATKESARNQLTAQKLDIALHKEPVAYVVMLIYVLSKMKTLPNLLEPSHAKLTVIAL
jgi:hypothetical protein